MPEPVSSADDLFETRLRQLLCVETTLAAEVLPQLLLQATSTDLRYALERHLAETERHADSVRELLSEFGARAEREPSPALHAIVAEHDRLLERVEDGNTVVADLMHGMAAAAIEHLEMSSYGFLSTLADALGHESVSVRLREILEQEEFALELVDRAVTKLLAQELESSRP